MGRKCGLTRTASGLTIHSSRTGFAGRLNSGVRRGTEHMSNVKDKRSKRAMLIVASASIFLAVISRALSLSLDTSLPVASFYDRVTGSNSHSVYFLGMYLVVGAVIPSITLELRSAGTVPAHRLGGILFSGGAISFLIYLCALMPASTQIGGGRFSVLLFASAKWSLAQGGIYGVLFCSLAMFFGLFFSCIFGGRRTNAGHA
jgi:hypothetical protein